MRTRVWHRQNRQKSVLSVLSVKGPHAKKHERHLYSISGHILQTSGSKITHLESPILFPLLPVLKQSLAFARATARGLKGEKEFVALALP